jgi:hypothetical protein
LDLFALEPLVALACTVGLDTAGESSFTLAFSRCAGVFRIRCSDTLRGLSMIAWTTELEMVLFEDFFCKLTGASASVVKDAGDVDLSFFDFVVAFSLTSRVALNVCGDVDAAVFDFLARAFDMAGAGTTSTSPFPDFSPTASTTTFFAGRPRFFTAVSEDMLSESWVNCGNILEADALTIVIFLPGLRRVETRCASEIEVWVALYTRPGQGYFKAKQTVFRSLNSRFCVSEGRWFIHAG